MKKSTTLLLLSAIAMVACGPKEPQTISGVIAEASMNNVVIVTATGDSICFSTVEADMSQANGTMLGDTAIVTFAGNLPEKNSVEIVAASKVVGVPTVYKIEGSWVQPIPCMQGLQGVTINADGSASSINMATLLYNSWTKEGSKLVLKGESIGNGVSSNFSYDWTIDTLTATRLVITFDGTTERFDRQ